MHKGFEGGPAVAQVRRETRLCPRCGQTLFADMDVCYGCLYDFTREHVVRALPSAAGKDACQKSDQVETKQLAPSLAGPPHLVLKDDLDEPLELEATTRISASPPGPAIATVPATFVLVRTGDMDVVVEVPSMGLHVGRSPANDVVLHAKSVSREHVVLMPADGGLVVRDLGSTNPPLFRGHPIEGSALVPFGQSFLICGTQFEPRHG